MVSTGSVRSRLLRLLLGVAGLAGIAAAAAGTAFYLAFVRDLPDIESVEDYQPPLASVVLDRDGQRIGEFFFERRRLIPLTEVPQHVVRAFVAAEDSAFFEHAGIDYPAIVRAAWANLRAGGEIVQGASTITQQTVKGLLLSPERKFRRKVKEILLARDIEQRLTKQEILYLYLNQIYFGHGAYGLREAAHTYFGKEVDELTVSESAQLAGLPKAPTAYSPHRNPELAEKRRRYVLDRMRAERYIDQAIHDEAIAHPPPLSPQPWRRSYQDAAYFTEEVRRYLFDTLGGETVLEGGLVIETTLDPHLQAQAVAALRRGLEELDRRQGYRGPERRVDSADMDAALAQLARDNGLADAKAADPDAAGEEPDDPAAVVAGAAETAGEAPASDDDALARPAADAPADPGQRLRERLAEEPLRGLVTGVEREAQLAHVAFAPGAKGVVHLEDVRWAREADPGGSAPNVKEIADVFRRGDVARFALRPPDPEAADPAADAAVADTLEIRVTLAQEPLVQGALLSFDLDSGDVLALVGGYDYDESQFDRVTQARRQPGSAFKPIIYGAALALTDEAGHKRYTPASIIHDRPKVYNDHSTGFIWKPKNYGREFYGPITLRTALAKSINTAAVHLCDEVGVGNVIAYAKRLGIESPLEPSLAMALGTSGVSLLELTRAYAVFPSGGRRVIPHFIRRVTDRYGNVLLENVALGNSFEVAPAPAEPGVDGPDAVDVASGAEAAEAVPAPIDPDQVISAEDAYLMTDLLRAVVLEGTGQSVAKLGRPLAGKTGTTNDQADAWFVGFSPELVTGVWVGHDEIRFLGAGETGARAAAPVWIDFMGSALADVPKRDFTPTGSIVFARIDRETGLLAGRQTRESVFQSFIAGTEPTETAETHRSTSEALRDLREDSLSSDQAVQLMRLEDLQQAAGGRAQ